MHSASLRLHDVADAELSRMFTRAFAIVSVSAAVFAIAGCASDDTIPTAASDAEPVAGTATGPGIEPSMRGTSPGVKW